MKPVLLYPDKRLREKSSTVDDVSTDEVQALCDDLLSTLEYYGAHGLSAIQIGVPLRVFCTHVDGETRFFLNPEIVETDGEQRFHEGCLSFPGVQEHVIRAEEVTVTALDRAGVSFTLSLDGLDAVAVQHEYDHLDGVLFIDKVSKLVKRYMLKKLKKLKKQEKRRAA